jgi:hypothetical protein
MELRDTNRSLLLVVFREDNKCGFSFIKVAFFIYLLDIDVIDYIIYDLNVKVLWKNNKVPFIIF